MCREFFFAIFLPNLLPKITKLAYPPSLIDNFTLKTNNNINNNNLWYRSVLKLTKSNPSSNRPENCSICNCCVWSYNFLLHFHEKHQGVACPIIISEEERDVIIQYKI